MKSCTQLSLRVFRGKVSKCEPCKSCKIPNNPYKVVACLPESIQMLYFGWYLRASIVQFSHLCPGLNAVTNFANFTIFRFSFKFNKFCDFSLNSTRYTKIRCLNDFSVRCAEIYNFMLIDHQAPACRFYKIYDFSLTSRFFNKPLRNLRFFAFLCNANSTS